MKTARLLGEVRCLSNLVSFKMERLQKYRGVAVVRFLQQIGMLVLFRMVVFGTPVDVWQIDSINSIVVLFPLTPFSAVKSIFLNTDTRFI
jgi:hypothetical protein